MPVRLKSLGMVDFQSFIDSSRFKIHSFIQKRGKPFCKALSGIQGTGQRLCNFLFVPFCKVKALSGIQGTEAFKTFKARGFATFFLFLL